MHLKIRVALFCWMQVTLWNIYRRVPEVIAKKVGEVWIPRLTISKLRLPKDELPIFKFNSDYIAIVEGTFQHLDSQRIEDIPLDCSP